MKKVFVISMFGKPFPWVQDYIDNVQHLEKDGWYWKILTPHELKSKGNVEIVNMNIYALNRLIKNKFDVKSNFTITAKGIPNIHITDYYIFSGVLFDDLIKDADFWGITNMDVVYGNLSKFIPDSLLDKCDVFSDEVNSINGVFSLFRNNMTINHLYERIENWRQILAQPPCKSCTSVGGEHTLYGSDEYIMSDVVNNSEDVRVSYSSPFPILSHDRLEQHYPMPKLKVHDDGSLWELFKDVKPPSWKYAHVYLGREIAYFHFQRTKRWPI